ncbi:MAG: hypothetical protein HOP91_06160 [Sphingomonas sp.]|nr:hypothetical protein [Sphingomonas sp.]
MRSFVVCLALLLLPSAASAQHSRSTWLDALARDYVVLALRLHLTESDAVVVTQPPSVLSARAKVPISADQAIKTLDALIAQIDRLRPPADPLLAMRQRSLRAHAASLALQLQPARMAKLPVAERMRRIYGFEPVFAPLASFDSAIDALDKALPGSGGLSDRIDAMKHRAEVPKDRIEAVVRSAVGECRRRAALHLRMPKESLTISYPTDPLVPGQSNYLGGGKGTMAVSTVVPADVDRLLQLSCHEAYPGHHTNYASMDEHLWRKRHWPESKVSLVFEPQFPVSEAISEYGTGLNFPLDERIRFEREVLYPLAGRTMQDEAAWRAYVSARSSVLGATSTVIRDYLDRKIDAATAKRLSMRYRLMNSRSADQLLKMVDAFGIDVIASDQGWLAIDRAFAGKPIREQWHLLQKVEEEPMLLDDVRALGRKR